MKYTVETTENGWKETLEIKGNTYTKEFNRTENGSYSSKDKDFCEQMEENGERNESLLDRIYDIIDDTTIGMDFKVFEED